MLNISNIQHFSVGDGEGIRTTVFLKGCNLFCPWCHNPENLKKEPATLRYSEGRTEILGRLVAPEDILPELLEDKDFYCDGGGVTFSGGEAMLQAEALMPLAALLKENGVSVLIDTAGCVSYAAFQQLNAHVDGYLLDFKTADAEKYKKIGGNLNVLTQNIRRLQADKISFSIRIPLIPGFNTEVQDVDAIGAYLKDLGIREAELLPFHRLGSAKYEAMGLEYAYRDQAPLAQEALEKIKENYKKYISVKIER